MKTSKARRKQQLTTEGLDLELHEKQGIAFNSPANEILYGGAAGGGKSHVIRIIAIFFACLIPGIQIYIFRRLSDDLLRNHMMGAGGFYALLDKWLADGTVVFNGSKNCLKFKNGSVIWLCHCQYEKDVQKYQGAEFHILFFDELTHFTEYQYRFLRARCRLGTLAVPADYAHKLPLIFSGTNPGSAGHTWVRKTFVDPVPYYECWKAPKDEGGRVRQFIPAVLSDNPSLNQEEYEELLSGLGNPELVRAMLNGDWDIVAGGALDDVWDKPSQILPRFRIPEDWRIFRTMDWGSTHPFSIGFWARASGTEAILPGDKVFCPPKGSLIRFNEWYGCDPKRANTGLKMPAKEIAKGILTRISQMRSGYWIGKTHIVHPGPADNEIYAVKEAGTGSIAKIMAKEGVLWCRSDKSKGSRRNGLEYVRSYLYNARAGEGEGLFFTENCRAAITILPQLPRDPLDQEDVDTKAEDHPYDEIRYAVLDQIKPASQGFPVTFTN